MGFDGHGRGRGGFRGSNRGGERGKSLGFKSRGGSPGGSFRGRGGGSGGRDLSSSAESRKGSSRGRDSMVKRHSGSTSNGHGGGGNFTPHGGRGGWNPRGGRKEFRGSGRGARGSFSEKRRTFHNQEDESNTDVGKNKKSLSATSTPVNTKKQNASWATNKRRFDDEDEDSVPLKGKKPTNGKAAEAKHGEETDSEDQNEEYADEDFEVDDEDEESDEDENPTVSAKKLMTPQAKESRNVKKNVVKDSDSEDEDDGEDEEVSDEEDDGEVQSLTGKATPKKDNAEKSNLKSFDSDEDDEDEEDDEEDDEDSEEDEEQVEPLMRTPALKQNEKETKSSLKSGKGTDAKKSVSVSEAATSAIPSKKLPVTPHPQKKVLSVKETPKPTKETPKTKLNFDDDSSDEEDEQLNEAAVEDEEDDDEQEDDEDEEEDDELCDEDDEDEEEEEQTSKHLETKSASMRKQVQSHEYPAQGNKKIVPTKNLSAQAQPGQGIKKTAVDDRTIVKKEEPGHGAKKKSAVADRSASVKKGHFGEDNEKKTADDSRAAITKKEQCTGIKRKAIVDERAAVLSTEQPGQAMKKKAAGGERAAVPISDHSSKGIKKKTDGDNRPKVVNKEQQIQAVKKKNAVDHISAVVADQHAGHGIKRKAAIDDSTPKRVKLDEDFIINEENKRRQERDDRSLFIKGFPKNTKTKELEDLHPDIESVRHRKGSSFAWIVFRNEASCNKAHDSLSTAKVGGKKVKVDFCGVKSTKKPQKSKEHVPVNPLELFINGIPPQVNKDDIKNVFRAAISIHIPNARAHETRRAFVLFSTEDDAKAAFDKGRGLKLGGRSVEVFYARVRKNVASPSEVKPSKDLDAKKVHPSNKAVASKVVENEGDSDDEEVESSDEGIEEVDERQQKKVTVKQKLEPQSDNEDDEGKEDEDDNDDDDYDEEEGDDDDEDDDE